MSEYSGAPGRGHRGSVGKHAMQVDRQPSPWPCVVMLGVLLLFCLMAPRYWRNGATPKDATIGHSDDVADCGLRDTNERPTEFAGKASFPGWTLNLDGIEIGGFANSPDRELLNLMGTPTIEDLIAARSGAPQPGRHYTNVGHDGIEWPALLTNVNGTADQNLQADPQVAVAVEVFGALLGEYVAGGAVQKWGAVVVEVAPRWVALCERHYDTFVGVSPAAETASPLKVSPDRPGGRFSVRVLDSRDRFAMLPEPRKLDTNSWCVPEVLYEIIDRVAGQPESAQWASQVRNQLHALTDRQQLDGDDVQGILGDLSEAAQDAMRMADRTENDRLRVELLRAHWALARRLDCWSAMHEKRVAAHFQTRVAARGTLGPYFESGNQAAPPKDVTALSNDLETYELNRDPKLGRYVVDQQHQLKSSENTVDRTVAVAVEQHYRNANVRIAITAEMLNRLAGQTRNELQPVHDQIAGTYVRGQSNVRSETQVLLDPSANEWQLQLTAKGVVESNTLADGGPVRFRSRGTTDFSAAKSIVVNDKGVQLKRSDVDASCRNRLVGVTTDYDWVPLLGGMARDRAVSEYRARQGRVRSQIESRVESQTRDSLDEQTRDAIDQIRQQTYDRFASELDEFGIELKPVEMKTTTERLVARVRLAGENQLGSHTPRPRALSDSLASAQVHETALTNVAVTLGLDGKRFTAPELQKMLREKFPNVASKTPIEARHDTVFQFAAQDSVRVHINDGRLELTISFASIELEGEATPNVAVHAYYVPKVDGLNAELVRDGTLGIEGKFSSAERARLHNIFNRVLPAERHLPIVRVDDPIDKRFEGLMITQLVLEDGWAGLAVGPTSSERVAERSRSLR